MMSRMGQFGGVCLALLLSILTFPVKANDRGLPVGKVNATDGYLYEMSRLDSGIYLFASPEPFHVQPYGNVIAVEQVDGFVLFDSGGTPAAADRILGYLDRLAPEKPVKAVIISHWHGDHLNGLRTIKQRWPEARTIATDATRTNLGDPRIARFMPTGDAASDATIRKSLDGAVSHFRTQAARKDLSAPIRAGSETAARELAHYGAELMGAAYLIPEEGFSDRMLLDDPERPVELRFLGRANTDGDAVAWLPRQRIVLTGDIVVSPIPYGFGSYPAEWRDTISALKGFDFKLLVPGHGRPMNDNAYLDRLSWLLDQVRAQVTPLARQGLSLEQVVGAVDLSAARAQFTGGDPWRAQLFDQYWRQPIIASAFKQALGQPIVQGGE